MGSTTATGLALPAEGTLAAAAPYWVLRIGAALCFIGHGAFGFLTKAAWVPYFGVVGVPEPWAFELMPLVGAVDVLAGMAVLFGPTRLPRDGRINVAPGLEANDSPLGERSTRTRHRCGKGRRGQRRGPRPVKWCTSRHPGWSDYAACFLSAGFSALVSTSSSSRLMVM